MQNATPHPSPQKLSRADLALRLFMAPSLPLGPAPEESVLIDLPLPNQKARILVIGGPTWDSPYLRLAIERGGQSVQVELDAIKRRELLVALLGQTDPEAAAALALVL